MLKKLTGGGLAKRALSAFVLAPIVFALIFYGGLPFKVLIAVVAFLALYEWTMLAMKTEKNTALLATGIVYVGIAFLCCYALRESFPPQVALLFVAMVWVSDSSAYFFGKIIGGPKMASEISPNKTWAGLAGAAIGPIILCFLYFLFGPDFKAGLSLTFIEILWTVVIGTMIGVVGQAGDLIVSLLKRQAGTKDTGQLIPGHGGILDRVDALMLTAPIFLFIVVQFPHVFTG